MTDASDVTRLLGEVASGDRAHLDVLLDLVYADLHSIAERQLRGERTGHTLQPTALVHEAYLRLVDQRDVDWRNRSHFCAVASRIIRRILVDHARARASSKRGGGWQRLTISGAAEQERDLDLVALDDALDELARIDERQSRIVELRFFGGLSLDEVAEVLDMGRRSVDRHWQAARAWLYAKLATDDGPADAG